MPSRTYFAFAFVWSHESSPLFGFLYRMYDKKPAYIAKYLPEFVAWLDAQKAAGTNYYIRPVWLALGKWFLTLRKGHKLYDTFRRSETGNSPLMWSPTGKREDPQWQPWDSWVGSPSDLTTAAWLGR